MNRPIQRIPLRNVGNSGRFADSTVNYSSGTASYAARNYGSASSATLTSGTLERAAPRIQRRINSSVSSRNISQLVASNATITRGDSTETASRVSNKIEHENKEVNTSPALFQEMLRLSQQYDCPICFYSSKEVNLCSTACGHVFCVTCIKKCTRCPKCRCKIWKDLLRPIFL